MIHILDICFEAIFDHLDLQLPRKRITPILTPASPLFVTWRKNNILIGCIGTLDVPKNATMHDILTEYAVRAAFYDRVQITSDDIPYLTCEVNILSDFEQISTLTDWTVGVHGVEIRRPGGYHATYLPIVAKTYKWNQEKTIEQLKKKSGWKPGIDSDIWWTATRYKSKQIAMSFSN